MIKDMIDKLLLRTKDTEAQEIKKSIASKSNEACKKINQANKALYSHIQRQFLL